MQFDVSTLFEVCSNLLLRTPLSPLQLEQAQTLRACGEQLLGTVNAILDFSKLEAGRLELEAIGFELPPRCAR